MGQLAHTRTPGVAALTRATRAIGAKENAHSRQTAPINKEQEKMTKRLDYDHIAPAGARALGVVYCYVMQSKLPAMLVNLVYLRVSQINNCAYCLDMHTRDLLKQGEKIERLALLQAWAEAGDLFDARERAALAWAETVTRVAETGVPDEGYQAARAVFEERELVDLTIAIGVMNMYNRMAISFRNTPKAVAELENAGA
jgi:AhpD family alkylhydroperoxidase